ncbi:LapD/MoxY N-terminal periplasmic domain-containing protein [Gallaecimonas kandeliae]|uniref:bifunctional diguanylate cyclase/phosphodiesterase n=1 Tax=Gallaecimonas kandeliae TaxID=3029055 RepID=UPI002649B069|nr:LapD/MoxY N-terminal periplasmic domain-containing protein [Gallaecimonas kandeliae]WKE65123.1 LapD/MoxY N-terminal periplasmic domain-containing protein [Gallaecimonas kandeliae]
MTLQRQILWFLSLSFLLVLLVVFVVEFNTSRDALDRQMETDVQNASTALGLTLSPFLEKEDRGAIDTVLQSIFDAGFYREIRLDWYAKGEVIAKNNSPHIYQVPNWFVKLPLFKPVSQEQVLTSGWLQVANLKVVGNPAVAYQALWRTGIQLGWTLGLLYLAMLLLVWRGVKHLLRPLHAVARQAKRITKRQFGEPIKEPKTRELKALVNAMNEMSTRVRMMFESQDAQISRMRLSTQTDPVSGLANRSHLMSHLSAWLSEAGTGGLMLMEIRWLDNLRKKSGYQARDGIIPELAARLGTLCIKGSRCVAARISHTEFALLSCNGDQQQLADWLQEVFQELQAFSAQMGQSGEELALALVPRGEHQQASALLASADSALHQAWQQTPHCYMPKEELQAPSQQGWRESLTLAIKEKRFGLLRQPAMGVDGDCLHQEWFVCLEMDGKRYPASAFLAFVEQFSLAQALDLAMARRLVQEGLLDPEHLNVLNLSLATVRSPDALLEVVAARHPGLELAFEVSEDIALADPVATRALVARLRKQRIGFGVDHVGRRMESLRYLHDLAPDHIKLDQSLACYEDDNEVGQEVIRALARIGQSLQIKVIATRVEKGEELQQIKSLGVQGYQGYIMPPQAL